MWILNCGQVDLQRIVIQEREDHEDHDCGPGAAHEDHEHAA